MLYNGTGVEKNIQQASHWYLKAANLGSDLSSFCLGLNAENGVDTQDHKPNISWAIVWYQISWIQGCKEARKKIASLKPLLTEDGLKNLERVLKAFATDKNFVWAQMALGDMYLIGDLVGVDYEQAFHFHDLAAKQGVASSIEMLGSFFLEGLGIPVDIEQGIQLLIEAARLGDSNAQARLAFRYVHGQGVTKDVELGAALFMTAAEKNNENALHDLGKMYREGIYFEKDLPKAFEYFSRDRTAEVMPGTDVNSLEMKDSNPLHKIGIQIPIETAAERTSSDFEEPSARVVKQSLGSFKNASIARSNDLDSGNAAIPGLGALPDSPKRGR
jgi:TPR repeat protein